MSGGQSQNATWSPNWHNAEFEFSTLTVSGHSTVEDKISHARPGRHPTRPRQLELQGLNEGQDPVEVHETMNFSRLLLPSMRGSSFDRKSTRLNSSHLVISYAVFCLKKTTPPARRQGVRGRPLRGARDPAGPRPRQQEGQQRRRARRRRAVRRPVTAACFFSNPPAPPESTPFPPPAASPN